MKAKPIHRAHLCAAVGAIAGLVVLAPALRAEGRAPVWCNTPGGGGYAGACRSSGGGTRTIVIEREVEIIQGPPIIVWKLPSAEGATSSEVSTIANPNLQAGLGGESTTPFMLFGKARRALRDGNCEDAFAYIQAALQRGPSASEAQDIMALKNEAQRKFDQAQCAKFKFQKSTRHTELLHIDGVPDAIFDQLFDPKRTDLEKLRQQMLPLFIEQSDAQKKIDELNSAGKKGAELKNAEAKLKVAQDAVQTKIKQNEKAIRVPE